MRMVHTPAMVDHVVVEQGIQIEIKRLDISLLGRTTLMSLIDITSYFLTILSHAAFLIS